MQDIIGHEHILNFFDKVIKNNNLSHAYIFVGREKLGKRILAEQISSELLNTEKEKLNIAPDFRLIEQAQDEKTGKTKKDISITQIKEAGAFLSQRPYLAKQKILIIDNAEKMSLGAANALLKTLEEPSKFTVLFLITRDENLLPQTIQSRCQKIYFHGVEKEKIEKMYENEELARLCTGLPGLAKEWNENPEIYKEFKQEILRFQSLPGIPLYEKLKKVDDLFGDPPSPSGLRRASSQDHIARRQKLVEILNMWQLLVRDCALEKNKFCQASPKKTLSFDVVVKVNDLIEEAKGMLQKNIHPRLLVERILLQLP